MKGASEKQELDSFSIRRFELEQVVLETFKSLQESKYKFQAALGELNKYNAENTNLNENQREGSDDQCYLANSESQCSGEIPALYDEGFAVYDWQSI